MGIAALILSLFPKRAHARLALVLTLSLFISIELAAPTFSCPWLCGSCTSSKSPSRWYSTRS